MLPYIWLDIFDIKSTVSMEIFIYDIWRPEKLWFDFDHFPFFPDLQDLTTVK